jgi:hypothetical protein
MVIGISCVKGVSKVTTRTRGRQNPGDCSKRSSVSVAGDITRPDLALVKSRETRRNYDYIPVAEKGRFDLLSISVDPPAIVLFRSTTVRVQSHS